MEISRKMKKTVIGLWALIVAMTGFLSSCSDDDENEYAIDIQQLYGQLPGTWTIDDVTIQTRSGFEKSERERLADGVPLSGRVEFDSYTFHTYDAYGQHFDVGTYHVGRYYIAFTRQNGNTDTLQIANVDKNGYQTVKLRYPKDKDVNIYFDLSKRN